MRDPERSAIEKLEAHSLEQQVLVSRGPDDLLAGDCGAAQADRMLIDLKNQIRPPAEPEECRSGRHEAQTEERDGHPQGPPSDKGKRDDAEIDEEETRKRRRDGARHGGLENYGRQVRSLGQRAPTCPTSGSHLRPGDVGVSPARRRKAPPMASSGIARRRLVFAVVGMLAETRNRERRQEPETRSDDPRNDEVADPAQSPTTFPTDDEVGDDGWPRKKKKPAHVHRLTDPEGSGVRSKPDHDRACDEE